MQHEAFNLDRHISIENWVDPNGKKWEIHGERGSALVHARPNPDRKDAVIPKEFSGKWTSPTVLREQIKIWLERQWDKADAAKQKAVRKEHAEKVEAAERKTAEESLAELPDEIKAELGDIIATETEDASTESEGRLESQGSEEDSQDEEGGDGTAASDKSKPATKKKAKKKVAKKTGK